MKIEIFDTKEFVDINKLEEVTSPIVFQRGGVPDPNGLLSTRIFGIDVRSRRTHFAYIDLNSYFFQPHVYKALKRIFRNIDHVVNGAKFYRIDAEGKLVEDSENGETGIEFIYQNWEKIKWGNEEESNMRSERINLLTKFKKNEIFTRHMIVIPVMYRDVILSNSGGETDPLNNLYSKLIRLKSLLKNRDMFDFTLHSTNFNIQTIMVEIYDIFKHKLERKNGMIRKYLMGKNVDNCIRSVISAPHYHDETPEDTGTKFGQVGVPLAQICSLCYPFIQAWLKNFFEREFIQVQEGKPIRNAQTGEVEYIKLYKPELYFTDKYIKNMVDLFIRDPESRFKPIQAPIGKDEFKDVMFTGKKLDVSDQDLSSISNRPMTVTDILYMAAHDVTHDKHGIVTRYPVSDAYGIFVAKINVVSTMTTEVVKINETVYSHYPKVELGLKPADILLRFIDAMQFSNSYLAGIGGDLTNHQVSLK